MKERRRCLPLLFLYPIRLHPQTNTVGKLADRYLRHSSASQRRNVRASELLGERLTIGARRRRLPNTRHTRRTMYLAEKHSSIVVVRPPNRNIVCCSENEGKIPKAFLLLSSLFPGIRHRKKMSSTELPKKIGEKSSRPRNQSEREITLVGGGEVSRVKWETFEAPPQRSGKRRRVRIVRQLSFRSSAFAGKRSHGIATAGSWQVSRAGGRAKSKRARRTAGNGGLSFRQNFSLPVRMSILSRQ